MAISISGRMYLQSVTSSFFFLFSPKFSFPCECYPRSAPYQAGWKHSRMRLRTPDGLLDKRPDSHLHTLFRISSRCLSDGTVSFASKSLSCVVMVEQVSGNGQRGGLGEEGVIVYMFTFKSRHTKMKYVHQSLGRQILDDQED